MIKNFPKSLALVLKHEGGFSNHPRDPGGATNFGVIQRVYDGYRSINGLKKQSVRKITRDEVEEIYARQYWSPIRGDSLPPGVDYCVFDGAVNSGPAQSAKWLQRALGVKADGVIGVVTLAAADEWRDKRALIKRICANRLGMLRALRTWDVFGRGWGRRVTECERDAIAMVKP